MSTFIFDFDGTIADTFFITVDVFRSLTKRLHSHRRTDDKEIQILRGLPARQAMKRVGLHMWQLPFVLYQGRKAMWQRIGEVKPFLGIVPALKELRKQGHTLILVSTNNARNVEAFFRAQGLDSLFAEVHAGIGLFSKAKTFTQIMQARGLNLADCAYVGDEVRDIDAAKRAELRCISVSWGYNSRPALVRAGADPIVDQPDRLVAAIERAMATA